MTENSIHMALKESLMEKRMAEVKNLIRNGADLSERNENLATPLHVAISQGFEDVAEVLIKKLPVQMLNTICRSGLTPLYLAVSKNDFKTAQLLLQHGASASRDSFVKDLNLITPLQLAFHLKNYKMIDLLLEYRAEVFESEALELRKLDLEWAMDHDYANIVISMIENGNTICCSGLTPLYYAVLKNDFKMAQILLKHGASASRDSFVKDLNLRTPLQLAFHFKNYKMINLLLEYRAEVFESEAQELRNLNLEWAMDQDYANIVISMIENGKCIPYETKSLALDWERLENGDYISYWKKPLVLKLAKSPRMAEQLLKHFFSEDLKVDFKIAIQFEMDGVIDHFIKNDPSVFNYVDAVGLNYLEIAIYEGRHQMVELLIKYGFDVNDKGNNDFTPLHRVWSKTFIARILIRHGANIHSRTIHGYTPLHAAAFDGFSNVADLLIQNGAEIDAKSNTKDTPLMMALANMSFKTIKCLSKLGASMKNRNDQGMSPLEVAIGKNLTPLSFKVLVFNMCS